MEEQLISKKELLELTSISYGQLYRWKRMNIIPEGWFIKKSSFTGQETFFPKEKILERVNKIIELKDDFSLEELADFFSPGSHPVDITVQQLEGAILKKETIQFLKQRQSTINLLPFKMIFFLTICEKVEATRKVSLKTAFAELTFIQQVDLEKLSVDLYAIQKNNESIWMLLPIDSPIILEENAKIHLKVSLLDQLNDLKIKLSNIH